MPVIRALVLVLMVSRLEALAAFAYRLVTDPVGTKYQIFLDMDAWLAGIALGWVIGIITIAALIAYADWCNVPETHAPGCVCYRCRPPRPGRRGRDRTRFW